MAWQKILVALSLVINVVLFYGLIWGGQGLSAYHSIKERHQALETRVKDLDAKNLALSREIRLLQSDAKYQEKVIRNRFNFVKDNEVLYIFPGAQNTAETGAGQYETKD